MVTLFVYDYCICPHIDNRGSAIIFNRKDRKSRASKNSRDSVLHPFGVVIDTLLYAGIPVLLSQFRFHRHPETFLLCVICDNSDIGNSGRGTAMGS